MNRSPCLKTQRGVLLRDLSFGRLMGAEIVRGVLYPSGEHFSATLWAISGKQGPNGITQVVYTDRGHYDTGLDAIEVWRRLDLGVAQPG